LWFGRRERVVNTPSWRVEFEAHLAFAVVAILAALGGASGAFGLVADIVADGMRREVFCLAVILLDLLGASVFIPFGFGKSDEMNR